MSRVVSALHRPSSRVLARVLPGAKAAPFPGFIEPCLASLVSKVPSGAGYVHEIKLDGYRIQAHLHEGRVTLFTRSGLDWTERFPTIAADIARLPAVKSLSLTARLSRPTPTGGPISERSKMISRDGVVTEWCTTPLTSCISTVSTRAVPR